MNIQMRIDQPFVIAALLSMLASSAFATAGTIDDAKGCHFVDPTAVPNERITWTGACRDGWGDGAGTLTRIVNDKTTSVYTGALVAGRPTGQGVQTFSSGNRYEGGFLDGVPQGRGALIWNWGMRYEGGFEHGQMNGEGSLRLPDSTRFEGRFEDDLLLEPVAVVKARIVGEVRIPMERADTPVDLSGVPLRTPGTPQIKVLTACAPQYPPAAIQARATGNSGFSLLVGTDSQVRRVRWFQRSGTDFMHQTLDLTAVASLLNCPIVPGTLDGHPAERWMAVGNSWKLD